MKPSITNSVIFLIRAYRAAGPVALSFLGLAPNISGCRFSVTCSRYAEDAIRTTGLLNGGVMAIGRLLRCRPLGQLDV